MVLKKRCNFKDFMEECGPVSGSLSFVYRPKTKVGYYRADYCGNSSTWVW